MFKCNREAVKDAKGVVTAVRVEWIEASALSEVVVGLLAMVATMASAVAFVGLILSHAPTLVILSPWVVVVLALWAVHGLNHYSVPRVVVFHRDGRIETPKGLGFNRKARWLTATADMLASIEVGQNERDEGQRTTYTHGVALIEASGEKGFIARRLEPNHALKVAVQLNNALREIREASAHKFMQRAGPVETEITIN